MTIHAKGTRDRLLDAAQQLFSEQTIHGANTNDIANLARCTRTTLHNHFRTKDDLLDALLRRELEKLNDVIPSPSGDTSASLRSDLIQLATAYHTFVTQRQFLIWAIPDMIRNQNLRSTFLTGHKIPLQSLTLLLAHYRDKKVLKPKLLEMHIDEIPEGIAIPVLCSLLSLFGYGMPGLSSRELTIEGIVDHLLTGYGVHVQ